MAEAGQAHQLVAAARDLSRIEVEATAGLWPRAATFLARQALGVATPDLEPLPSPAPAHEMRAAKLSLCGDVRHSPRVSAQGRDRG
jgi:hypothetical protein